MKKIVISAIAAALFSSALCADVTKYEITPTVGKYFPSNNKDLQDKLAYGLKAGAFVDSHWGAELGFDRTLKMNDTANGGKTTDTLYTLDAVYNYGNFAGFTPFAMAGAGYQDFGKEASKRKDGALVNWGLGVKYAITDMFSLRADARQIIGVSKRTTDYIASLGLAIAFGEKAPVATPAPAVQAPKAESKAVSTPEVKAAPKAAVATETQAPKAESKAIRLNVNFDTSKSVVKAQYMKEISDFAEYMKANPKATVEIQGHTDNRGKKAKNQKLSLARAEAIKSILVNKFGINAARITTKGMADEKPLVANDSKENMLKNRRMEAIVTQN